MKIQHVMIEIEDGSELRATIAGDRILEEDQLVTARIYSGKLVVGFITELLGEENVK